MLRFSASNLGLRSFSLKVSSAPKTANRTLLNERCIPAADVDPAVMERFELFEFGDVPDSGDDVDEALEEALLLFGPAMRRAPQAVRPPQVAGRNPGASAVPPHGGGRAPKLRRFRCSWRSHGHSCLCITGRLIGSQAG